MSIFGQSLAQPFILCDDFSRKERRSGEALFTRGRGMDWIVFSAVASCFAAIGGLVVAVIKLWLVRKDKADLASRLEKEEKESEATRKATKEILDHTVGLRKLLDEKETRIRQLEKQIDELYKVVPEARTSDILAQRRTELERQKLDMQKEREQWKKLIAVAKGIGWVLDRMKEDDEG